MILRRLRLKNYRKYSSLDLEFPTGLVGVVGRNGAGKTTLLEAVAFVLYGSEASRTKAKGVRNDGAGKDDSCEVELEFSIGGEPYRIVRLLRGINETHQAEMYKAGDPAPIATGVSGVLSAVKRLIGMDYSTFTRSVFSKQKEVNALSDARPDERRQTIRRMVGVETVTRARESAKAERKAKEAEVAGARRAIEALPDKRKEIKDAIPRLKSARAEVQEKTKIAAAAAKLAKATGFHLNRLEEKRTAYTEFDKKASGLSGDLRGAEKRQQKLRDEMVVLKEAKTKYDKLLPEDRKFALVRREKESFDRSLGKYEERVELERETAGLADEINSFKSQLEKARGAAEKLKGASDKLRSTRLLEKEARFQLAKLQKERGNEQKNLGSAGSQVDRVKKALKDIQTLGPTGKCPTCYRHLGDSFEEVVAHLRSELRRHTAAIDGTKKRIKEIDAKMASINKQIADAVGQVKAATKQAESSATARAEVTAAKEKYTRAVGIFRKKSERLKRLLSVHYDREKHRVIEEEYGRLSLLHDKAEALRQEIGRSKSVEIALKSTTTEANTLRGKIKELERRKLTLKFDPEEYVKAREANASAQAKDKTAAVAASNAKGELGRVEEIVRRLEDEIKRLEELRSRISKDEESIQYLGRIEAVLDDFRSELINRIRPQIEEFASVLFDQVTEGRYPRIMLDEDYDISIHDGAGAFPIRRYSGGEEDLANLCLRLAISQIVADRAGANAATLVVLDEIFASQDIERRDRILRALSRLQETFQQIILITHMEDIHDRIPNVLFVRENAAHQAEATWM
jgi:DNA repair protein SbcC/Rad50